MLHLPARSCYLIACKNHSFESKDIDQRTPAALLPHESGRHRTPTRNQSARGICAVRLCIPKQPAGTGLREIDDSIAIDRNSLAPAATRKVGGLRVRNKETDLSVTQAADPHPTFDGGIHVWSTGLRIGRIQGSRSIQRDAARTSPLLPLRDELPVLIKYLDPAVAAIGDKESPLRVQHESVRCIEFAGSGSLRAPRLDELALLVELDDARVAVAAMTIGHEDAAVGRHEHI